MIPHSLPSSQERGWTCPPGPSCGSNQSRTPGRRSLHHPPLNTADYDTVSLPLDSSAGGPSRSARREMQGPYESVTCVEGPGGSSGNGPTVSNGLRMSSLDASRRRRRSPVTAILVVGIAVALLVFGGYTATTPSFPLVGGIASVTPPGGGGLGPCHNVQVYSLGAIKARPSSSSEGVTGPGDYRLTYPDVLAVFRISAVPVPETIRLSWTLTPSSCPAPGSDNNSLGSGTSYSVGFCSPSTPHPPNPADPFSCVLINTLFLVSIGGPAVTSFSLSLNEPGWLVFGYAPGPANATLLLRAQGTSPLPAIGLLVAGGGLLLASGFWAYRRKRRAREPSIDISGGPRAVSASGGLPEVSSGRGPEISPPLETGRPTSEDYGDS
jgi:hypothetical protein